MKEQSLGQVDGATPGTRRAWHGRMALGTLLGLTSALGYTLSNICLRTVTHCDPIWVSCIKAVPLVVFILPWIMSRIIKREMLVNSKSDLAIILAAATIAQIGNVSFQWSLGIVGLALAVPFTLSTVILSGVGWGRWLLGEIVTARTVLALILVIVSICILSFGAGEAHRSVQRPAATGTTAGGTTDANTSPGSSSPVWIVAIGVVVACLAGAAYGTLGASIRWVRDQGTPLSSILFVSGMVGVVSLGAICVARGGVGPLLATTPRDLSVMVLAGVFNAIAFAALAAALHRSGLVFVNTLNASQTAMASIAGVLFFGEAVTASLAIGVPLTMVGVVLMKSTRGK